jgi:ADP-heptose:LPS heptosyltransferase
MSLVESGEERVAMRPGAVVALLEVGWVGDSIVTLPAMRAVREALPQARILRVLNREMVDFFRGCPYADALVPYDKAGAKLRRSARLLRELRWRCRPDAIVSLHTPDFDRPLKYYVRDSLFLALSGARHRLGYFHSIDRCLLTGGITRAAFGRAAIAEEILRVVEPLTGPLPGLPAVSHWLLPAETDEAMALLHARGLSSSQLERGFFCVSPFAKVPVREWSLGQFAAATHKLAAATGLAPVLLGRAADRGKLRAWSSSPGHGAVDLVGATSLRAAAAVLSRARLAVAVDSGLMHLAALVGCPTVAIFGPGNPQRWRPLPQAPLRIVHAGPPCGPCYRSDCPDGQCFKGISVDQVVAAATELVNDCAEVC